MILLNNVIVAIAEVSTCMVKLEDELKAWVSLQIC